MPKLADTVTGARVVGGRMLEASRKDPEGRMPLMEHIRELRNRLVKAALAVLAGMIVGLIFFHPIWSFITRPFYRAATHAQLIVSGLLVGFVVVVQTRDLGLKDPHRPAERPGRDRQFPGPEEHDEHDGDNQDFPRTVKKVAYHFRPLWRGWSPPAVRAFHGRVYTSRPRHRETPAGRAVCGKVNIPVGTLW